MVTVISALAETLCGDKAFVADSGDACLVRLPRHALVRGVVGQYGGNKLQGPVRLMTARIRRAVSNSFLVIFMVKYKFDFHFIFPQLVFKFFQR